MRDLVLVVLLLTASTGLMFAAWLGLDWLKRQLRRRAVLHRLERVNRAESHDWLDGMGRV